MKNFFVPFSSTEFSRNDSILKLATTFLLRNPSHVMVQLDPEKPDQVSVISRLDLVDCYYNGKALNENLQNFPFSMSSTDYFSCSPNSTPEEVIQMLPNHVDFVVVKEESKVLGYASYLEFLHYLSETSFKFPFSASGPCMTPLEHFSSSSSKETLFKLCNGLMMCEEHQLVLRDEKDNVLGIFTELDAIDSYYNKKDLDSEHFPQIVEVYSVQSDESMHNIISIFLKKRSLSSVFVRDNKNQNIIGVITARNIIHWWIKHLNQQKSSISRSISVDKPNSMKKLLVSSSNHAIGSPQSSIGSSLLIQAQGLAGVIVSIEKVNCISSNTDLSTACNAMLIRNLSALFVLHQKSQDCSIIENILTASEMVDAYYNNVSLDAIVDQVLPKRNLLVCMQQDNKEVLRATMLKNRIGHVLIKKENIVDNTEPMNVLNFLGYVSTAGLVKLPSHPEDFSKLFVKDSMTHFKDLAQLTAEDSIMKALNAFVIRGVDYVLVNTPEASSTAGMTSFRYFTKVMALDCFYNRVTLDTKLSDILDQYPSYECLQNTTWNQLFELMKSKHVDTFLVVSTEKNNKSVRGIVNSRDLLRAIPDVRRDSDALSVESDSGNIQRNSNAVGEADGGGSRKTSFDLPPVSFQGNTARDLMLPVDQFSTISKDQNLLAACNAMIVRNLTSLLVSNNSGGQVNVYTILAIEDLINAYYTGLSLTSTTIEKVVGIKKLIYCLENLETEDVLALMVQNRAKHLFVMDDVNIIGLISYDFLLSKIPEQTLNLSGDVKSYMVATDLVPMLSITESISKALSTLLFQNTLCILCQNPYLQNQIVGAFTYFDAISCYLNGYNIQGQQLKDCFAAVEFIPKIEDTEKIVNALNLLKQKRVSCLLVTSKMMTVAKASRSSSSLKTNILEKNGDHQSQQHHYIGIITPLELLKFNQKQHISGMQNRKLSTYLSHNYIDVDSNKIKRQLSGGVSGGLLVPKRDIDGNNETLNSTGSGYDLLENTFVSRAMTALNDCSKISLNDTIGNACNPFILSNSPFVIAVQAQKIVNVLTVVDILDFYYNDEPIETKLVKIIQQPTPEKPLLSCNELQTFDGVRSLLNQQKSKQIFVTNTKDSNKIVGVLHYFNLLQSLEIDKLKSITAKDLMIPLEQCDFVEENATLFKAMSSFLIRDVPCLLIKKADRNSSSVVGVLSPYDVVACYLAKFSSQKTTLEKIMDSLKPVNCRDSDNLKTVIDLVLKYQTSFLCVRDKKENLLGVVFCSQIMNKITFK